MATDNTSYDVDCHTCVVTQSRQRETVTVALNIAELYDIELGI